jgi:IMP dehydrogenase
LKLPKEFFQQATEAYEAIDYTVNDIPKHTTNKEFNMQKALSFDDVLLVPKYSDIESRTQVSIGNDLDESIHLNLPVISSPMDTVTEDRMCLAMTQAGAIGILHRYNTIEEQIQLAERVFMYDIDATVGAAIGMTGDYMQRAIALCEAGVSVLCVDVAHGHHVMMERCLKSLKERFGNSVHIMAGNVATLEAFDALASWGADSIRVGIGGGSICSTRLVTGHGIPTFASVLDCARTTYGDVKIIADGGIKTTGDMVKAYAAGADFVMVGSMLAGTEESPGETLHSNSGKRYKIYRGMASAEAQRSWRDRSSTPEGISTTIPFRGSVGDILQDLAGGIRSGLSYSGVRNLQELRCKADFIRQSGAGQIESSTHITRRN